MDIQYFIKKAIVFFDEHSGVVMCFLTAIYVIATVAIHRGNKEAVGIANATKNIELMDERLKLVDKVEQSSEAKSCLNELGFERRFNVLFPDEKLLEQLGKYKDLRDKRIYAQFDADYYRANSHHNIKEGVFEFENAIIGSFSDSVSEEERTKIKQLAKEREIYYDAPVKELSKWLNLYEIHNRKNIAQQQEDEVKAELISMMQEYVSQSIN